MKRVLALVGLAALGAIPCVPQDLLPTAPPLADFPGIVDVIVVSEADQIDAVEVRMAALRRLRNHGVLVEWASMTEQPRLIIDVEAFHDTPRSGAITHHTYYVRLRVEEPMSTERSPESLFMGTTWSTRYRLATFGADVDDDPLVESVIRGVNSFIRDVLIAREAAR
jgi:hypothetical protein